MKHRSAAQRIFVITMILLSVPLVAMQFTTEVNWSAGDFLVAAILIAGALCTYEFMILKSRQYYYRIAAGLSALSFLLLVWVNLAVGIIGNEGNPANLIYFGILIAAVVGALISRFKPTGMSYTLIATALLQAAIALTVYLAGLGQIFMLSAGFIAIWLVAAWFFRKAATPTPSLL